MPYNNRGGPSQKSTNWRRQPLVQQYPQQPFGTKIQSLVVDDLSPEAEAFERKAVISGCVPVASYSWLNVQDPTILVPGKPPRWTPLRTPSPLPEDSGDYYRDKNAARYPKHPMEPTVLASLATPSSSSTPVDGDIDIVACSSTLGNLLRFAKGQDKLFRMLVEVVDGTVFFIRRENFPTELIEGVRGFGHSFPEYYTTWDSDVKDSDNHQRILRYSLGGLSLLVRFGVDGYMISNTEKVNGTPIPAATSSVPSSLSALEASLSTTKISSQKSPATDSVSLRSGGEMVDQSAIFDLKTRSIKKKADDTIGDELPRLWVAQIPNFILAYHQNGFFSEENIQIHDVRRQLETWEVDNSAALSKYAALLHRIVDLVRHGNCTKIEVCHTRAGILEIREQLPACGDALSPAVKDMWHARRDLGGGESSSEAEDEFKWDDQNDEDFTACTAACGYCGHCTYRQILGHCGGYLSRGHVTTCPHC
ncbi:Uu.00g064930.m01.CDS01 [Anthostomella pinea]|uniref:Uu.00g064930.m01.CDS01 n=1 Tax=Anthostomella pinea TaxID=933095 RepID=A0AAI8VTP3_9PEZI|nr:Uu.00g064930.m01.CDS01 [Anthostomella pinea]